LAKRKTLNKLANFQTQL